VKDAEANEAEDKKKREEIERRNKLDSMCYTLEKTLTDNKDKVSEGDAKMLLELIAESRKAIESQDDAAVQTSLEKLEKEAHRIAGAMYGQTPGGPGGPDAGEGGAGGPAAGGGGEKAAGGKPKDGVIDAEFEEAN
jgi:molecular chaperone DnaK